MKALVWHGKGDIRCDNVPDPTIEDPRDMIVKITTTAICGSDLHLMDGYMPMMEEGDILGHEPMGEVVEVGKEVRNHKVGERVIPQPERHVFLKPNVTRRAAETYGFDFSYNSKPNSDTYQSPLDFAETIRRDNRDLKPRDVIE